MSISHSTSCLALLINHMLFYVNACQTLINTEKKKRRNILRCKLFKDAKGNSSQQKDRAIFGKT